ncbi:unnamed protein product, partial [marine sediment metagenome]
NVNFSPEIREEILESIKEYETDMEKYKELLKKAYN